MLKKYLILFLGLVCLTSCAKIKGKFNSDKKNNPLRSESLDFPPHYFLPQHLNNAPSHEDVD